MLKNNFKKFVTAIREVFIMEISYLSCILCGLTLASEIIIRTGDQYTGVSV